MATCPTCRTQYDGATTHCPADGAELLEDEAFASADASLAPGDLVGEYRVEAKIGEGGFGAVYRAVHPLIGKAAAVKVLNRQYSSNPQMVSRFIAEARAVNQIRHRNIIDIFAFGQLADGRQYYVMELLDGMPMDAYLAQKGPLPPAEALPILRQIARALDAAHASGIAHRDLKPENIFLVIDDEGTVFPKLLDFGIAKLLTDSSSGHKTRTGTPMGTPYYMSPEQCRGRDVDHRTDVYSFGVLCHRTLTGQLPFDGADTIEILVKQTMVAAPPMSTVLPELTTALDAPVLHMLEKEPSARPTSLALAIDELAAAAEGRVFVPGSRPGAAVGATARSLATPQQLAELGGAPTLAGANATTSTDPATTGGGGKKSPIVLGVIAIAVAAAAAMFMLRGSGPSTSGPPPAPSVAPAPTRAADPAATAPASATSTPVPVVAPAAEVDVTVQATPTNAEVFLGPDRLGTAPGPFKLKRGDAKVKLAVKADGYKPADVEVTPSANAVVSITLARLAAGPAKPPRQQPGEIENPFK